MLLGGRMGGIPVGKDLLDHPVWEPDLLEPVWLVGLRLQGSPEAQ